MNKPPDPPPPPKFERRSKDAWNQLTEEDLAWLEKAEREGYLPNMTVEETIAAVEAGREQFLERLRRAGFDPGKAEGSTK
jgi:hypothetical protein